MDAQWDPTTPIAVLFTCIEDCKIFAKSGEETFTEKNILCSAYLAIEYTGLFNLPCDIWRDNPTSAKNWSNLKLLFTKKASNTQHHFNGSFGINEEASNAILQPSKAFTAQQQEIENMHAVQEQTVNSAPEYKDLRSKVEELMEKSTAKKFIIKKRVEIPQRLNPKEPPRRTVALKDMIRMDTP